MNPWIGIAVLAVGIFVTAFGRAIASGLGSSYFAKSLARLNANLDTQSQIQATRFLHLSEKRLEIAVEIFSQLQAARTAMLQATTPLRTLRTPTSTTPSLEELNTVSRREQQEDLGRAVEPVNEFIRVFNNHRFLFPTDTVSLFDQAERAITTAFMDAREALDWDTEPLNDSVSDEAQAARLKAARDLRGDAWKTVKDELPAVITAIEHDLRYLSGVTHDDNGMS